MPMSLRSPPQTSGARVLVLTADPEFEQCMRAAALNSARVSVNVVSGSLPADPGSLSLDGADILIVDVDACPDDDPHALERLVTALDGRLPVITATQAFHEEIARRLLHLRIADFLLKPVTAAALLRACTRVLQAAPAKKVEAKFFTFLPASGGVGVTTIAIQSALLLLRSEARGAPSTCLVDLDFQQGSCADYLDLEPRLDLDEIEPRPERLDAQLLEVMLSQHSSGLSVICAPNRPAEMRSFDPNVVARLLDLVSMRFKYVVLDLPRTWFPWTDSVLVGSNEAFIVTEATVPGLRHANALIAAIKQRLGEAARPRVIVNRFEQRFFGAGLRRGDIAQSLGGALAGTVPNSYQLVREAIDRGVPLEEIKPRNRISSELKKLVLPPLGGKPSLAPASTLASQRAGLFDHVAGLVEPRFP
jgi:pilus assembly protein CpaE